MRRSLTYLSLFTMACVALAASACNTSSHDPAPVTPLPHEQVVHPESAPLEAARPRLWTIRYTSKCPGSAPDKCSGGYGFSVSSDGHFEVGPGPRGELLTGHVDPDELETIKASVLHAQPACTQSGEAPASERVDVAAEQTAAPSCDPALLTEARALSTKYYPPAFPSPCIDAALTLEKSYVDLTRCERDSDCSYIDETYMPVDAQRTSTVPLDDCTFIKPLVVANAFETVASQLKLVMTRALVRQICGTGLARPSCSHPTSLNPTAETPRCEAGVCRAHL